MRIRLVLLVTACSAAGAFFGACGREVAGTVPLPPSGPPRWSAARGEPAHAGVLADIKADAPCRVFFTVVGPGVQASEGGERLLAAGELARFWWRGEAFPAPKDGTVVSLADAAVGRTEGWVAALDFGWQGSERVHRAAIVGVRPGRGSARGPRDALPPAAPAVLPFEGQQLCAVAVVDGGAPEVALVAGERGSRLQGPLDEAAGDRATLLRLVVRVERVTR